MNKIEFMKENREFYRMELKKCGITGNGGDVMEINKGEMKEYNVTIDGDFRFYIKTSAKDAKCAKEHAIDFLIEVKKICFGVNICGDVNYSLDFGSCSYEIVGEEDEENEEK